MISNLFYLSGETVDEELEKRNFEFAGKLLSDIWSNCVIDEHPVAAEYIKPKPQEDLGSVDYEWESKHMT